MSNSNPEGARLGAPQAIQAADKWHLLKKLGEALEVLLAHYLAAHRKHQIQQQGSQEPVLLEKRSPRRQASLKLVCSVSGKSFRRMSSF